MTATTNTKLIGKAQASEQLVFKLAKTTFYVRVDISKKKRPPVISKHRFQVRFGHFALAGAHPATFSKFTLLFSWFFVGAWQERI